MSPDCKPVPDVEPDSFPGLPLPFNLVSFVFPSGEVAGILGFENGLGNHPLRRHFYIDLIQTAAPRIPLGNEDAKACESMRAVPNKLKDHIEKRECPSKLPKCHTIIVFQAVSVFENWKITYLKKLRL